VIEVKKYCVPIARKRQQNKKLYNSHKHVSTATISLQTEERCFPCGPFRDYISRFVAVNDVNYEHKGSIEQKSLNGLGAKMN
jgi:tetraacyldisaccharide-1-P 4'-kinase